MNVIMKLTGMIFALLISALLQLASPNFVSFFFTISCSFHSNIIYLKHWTHGMTLLKQKLRINF